MREFLANFGFFCIVMLVVFAYKKWLDFEHCKPDDDGKKTNMGVCDK